MNLKRSNSNQKISDATKGKIPVKLFVFQSNWTNIYFLDGDRKKLIHKTIAITIFRVSGRRTVTAAIKNDNNNTECNGWKARNQFHRFRRKESMNWVTKKKQKKILCSQQMGKKSLKTIETNALDEIACY